MKTIISSFAALFALAQLICAAPNALRMRDSAPGNTTFVLNVVIGLPAQTIKVDDASGLYVGAPRGISPTVEGQRFIYDPIHHQVVLDDRSDTEHFVYVGPDGHWQLTNASMPTPPQGSTTYFNIQPFDQGHLHDGDQELKAYASGGQQELGVEFMCQDDAGNSALFSTNTSVPASCKLGGYLGLQVVPVNSTT